MTSQEKQSLTLLLKDTQFSDIIHRLTIGKELTFSERCYILACAVYFMRFFSKNPKYSCYAEFAYFIILKYTVRYDDIEPLIDYCSNFGFYPIVRKILDQRPDEFKLLSTLALDHSTMKFKRETYVETLEQFSSKRNI